MGTILGLLGITQLSHKNKIKSSLITEHQNFSENYLSHQLQLTTNIPTKIFQVLDHISQTKLSLFQALMFTKKLLHLHQHSLD